LHRAKVRFLNRELNILVFEGDLPKEGTDQSHDWKRYSRRIENMLKQRTKEIEITDKKRLATENDQKV